MSKIGARAIGHTPPTGGCAFCCGFWAPASSKSNESIPLPLWVISGALMSGALLDSGATLGRWDPGPEGQLAASTRSLVRPRMSRHVCNIHAMTHHG